jgi:outer membrane protein TolC
MTTDRLRGILVAGFFGLVPAAAFAQPPAGVPVPMPLAKGQAPAQPPAPKPVPPKTLTVGECTAVGLEQQPAMKAMLESLKSAEQGRKAMDNLPLFAYVIRPDLDVRKKQGDRGLDVAAAAVQKQRDEIVHDIGYLYYTYVYAHQQDTVVTDLVVQLEQILDIVRKLLNAPDPRTPVTKFTEFQIVDGLGQVKALQVTARSGKQLALAALKEAMGVDPSFDFVPKDVELPLMKGNTTLEQVTELALTRRPELAMAAGGVDVFRLEVESQSKIRFRRTVQTLAIGADLHATALPTALRNGEYKPAPTPPEMPLSLLGTRQERVERACTLSLRQDAVYEKIVNLVRLEATKAYLTWRQDADALEEAKIRFDNANKLIALAKTSQNLDKEKLIQYLVTAGKAQSDYLTAAHSYVKSLLVLERVTSGGVRPAFPGK